MYIEIVTPEQILYQGQVSSVWLPSINGTFQMLENHAPVIAVLANGTIKFAPQGTAEIFIENRFSINEKNEYIFEISGGTIEQKDNKAIILVE